MENNQYIFESLFPEETNKDINKAKKVNRTVFDSFDESPNNTEFGTLTYSYTLELYKRRLIKFIHD